MELKQYLSTLWKWSWLIVLSTVIAAVSSFWATSRMPRTYNTTTTLMVGRFTQMANPTGEDFATSQQLAQTYVQLVRRQPVLQAAIEALGLNVEWQALAERVNVNLVAGTQLIQISVQDTDPLRAKALADEIAHQLILQSPTPAEQEQGEQRQFVRQQLETLKVQIADAEKQIKELQQRLALENSARGIEDIQNQIAVIQQRVTAWQGNYASLLSSYQGSRTNYLSVVEPAPVPIIPVSPKTGFNVLLATAIGFTLAAGAAFLLEYLDDTLKSSQDVDRVLSLPTLGSITRIQAIHEPSDALVTIYDPRSPVAEAYRALRTNLRFSSLSAPSTQLLITSANPGEGKTVTASNLGITIASAGKRVILVDTDLRQPAVHRLFGVSNQIGLTSLLLDDTLPIETALVETPVASLRLMPSGPLPPNPAELLDSEPMKQRLSQLKELADVIICDSPPVLAVADAAILGSLCSGVILVVDAGRTRSDMARRAKETLAQVNLKISGVVLNRLTTRHARSYSHYYSYYSHVNGKRQRRHHGRSSTAVARGFKLLAGLPHSILSRPSRNGRSSVVEVEDEEKT